MSRSWQSPLSLPMNRRGFLAAGGATAAAIVLGACSREEPGARTEIGPGSDAVRAAEDSRRAAGSVVRAVRLRAEPTTVDLGGVTARTWTYGGRLPGQEIRLARGEVLRAEIANALPAPTTIHWHGVALRNDMDGVPDLTQSPIASGTTFQYEFTVPDAGTYWFHPHVGVQLDRGLYAPLIVEDPADGSDYDLEAVVVLDDWLDGIDGRDPDQQLKQLLDQGMAGMDMGGMGHGEMGSGASAPMQMPADPNAPLGTDTGDVEYPYFLINGRLGTDPVTLTGRPGQRIRLRIINAASDTAFRVAVGGHQLRVTHSDGFPVEPVTGECLLIGMGERYDAIVELGDGVFPLVAAAEGKAGQGVALIRTSAGAPPPANARPAELTTAPITAGRLTADESVRLPKRTPDRTLDLTLGADMTEYKWTINGKAHPQHTPLDVTEAQRVRLRFINKTMMFHPMHLHGHTYQVVTPAGTGPRKDTSVVLPMQTVEVDLDTNNPGQWLVHCHNVYHGEAGMMSVLSYIR
ncbi:multicopper oxidase family protein [Nocardia cyriacigeorgica]|uniref:Multicopper oxidase family protein n=2 Tax=Nocardia TaxID=1817 RepID=A0A5R8PC45_9NOCA|nr:multicopper oxidase family protein [Nocardia cyriacigeorgica]MBF6424052.1 multicopper oxidase family protein [Nocardia cyriacigeorgica]TLF56691.1 multicopper oxidase family protein [Nocardia cyriacigeorgica]TLG08850.1 multicopper oxidase family protein [Nocardia cyriacigeorgica]